MGTENESFCTSQVQHSREEPKRRMGTESQPLPRAGLKHGDIVVFEDGYGRIMGAMEVNMATYGGGSDTKGSHAGRHGQQEGPDVGAESTAALRALVSDDHLTMGDPASKLEVVCNEGGEWIGLRSKVAGNKLLQAKRHGEQKLVFYSERFGVGEQWSVVERESLDKIHWNVATITLKNRKLPTCTIRVRAYRAGEGRIETSTLFVNDGSKFSSSLAARDGKGVPNMEDQGLRRISGMMVEEWIAFVQKEKMRRSELEAKVVKAVEDVEGLRQWAAKQIQCARNDVQEEIELLLEALQSKTEALVDVQSRLTMRVRWGAALLEAKKATILGRRVLLVWKSLAARSKYYKVVVEKLQRRSQLRAAVRALEAWGDHCTTQKDRQLKLRAGVRRMSVLRMQHTFTSWRRMTEDSKAEKEREDSMNYEAEIIAQAQRARHALHAWRVRANRAKEAHRILQFASQRNQGLLLADTFRSWRSHTVELKEDCTALQLRVEKRHGISLLKDTIRSWRVKVDDMKGLRINRARAESRNAQNRLRHAFDAWKNDIAYMREAEALVDSKVKTKDRAKMQDILSFWKYYADSRQERRCRLVGFVSAKAQGRLSLAFWFWREHARHEALFAAYVQRTHERRNLFTMSDVLYSWRAISREKKMQEHFVSICQERNRQKRLRGALYHWRSTNTKSTKSTLALMSYSEVWARRRIEAAFYIMQLYALENKQKKAMYARAVSHHNGRLVTKTMLALEESLIRNNMFLSVLKNIGRQDSLKVAKKAWLSWIHHHEENTGLEALRINFQARRNWHTLNGVFVSWKRTTQKQMMENRLLVRGNDRIQRMRVTWMFDVWRNVSRNGVEDAQQEGKADQWRARSLMRKSLNAMDAEMTWMKEVESMAGHVIARRGVGLRRDFLAIWREVTAEHLRLQEISFDLTEKYAFKLQKSLFAAWRGRYEYARSRREHFSMVIEKLAHARVQWAFRVWLQSTEDTLGQNIVLEKMEHIYMKKNRRKLMSLAFQTWLDRIHEIKDGLYGMATRASIRQKALGATIFKSWRKITQNDIVHIIQSSNLVMRRRSLSLLGKSLAAWVHETRLQARHSLVMLHAIERVSFKSTKQAFTAWRVRTQERKEKRDTVIHLLETAIRGRMHSAFHAWRAHTQTVNEHKNALSRCLIQKRLAFENFKNWYWDSMDEELQKILCSMFEEVDDTEDEPLNLEDEVTEKEDYTEDIHESLLDNSIDLDSISDNFMRKRDALMSRVQQALRVASVSPGKPLAPSTTYGQGLVGSLHDLFLNKSPAISDVESLSCLKSFDSSSVEDDCWDEIRSDDDSVFMEASTSNDENSVTAMITGVDGRKWKLATPLSTRQAPFSANKSVMNQRLATSQDSDSPLIMAVPSGM